MGFRFRKSIKILPGVRVNLGTRGASLSVGGRGGRVNFSSRGVRSTVGIPGTGISYTTHSTWRGRIASRTGAATAVGVTAPGTTGGEVGGFVALTLLAFVLAVVATWTLFVSVPVLGFFAWALWDQARTREALAALHAPFGDATAVPRWPEHPGTDGGSALAGGVGAYPGALPVSPTAPVGGTPSWSAALTQRAMASGSTSAIEAGRPLSPSAQLILENRPPAWEYLLFAKVLADEVQLTNPAFLRAFGSRRSATGERVVVADVPLWIQERCADARALVQTLGVQMNSALQVALGPPGESGDPGALIAVARRVGACYAGAVEWRARVRGVALPRGWAPVRQALTPFCDGLVSEIDGFSPRLTALIADRAAGREPVGASAALTMKIEIPPGAVDAFEAAMAAVTLRH